MPTKQNIVGGKTEKDFLTVLRSNHYWGYRTPNNFGQPVDLIFGRDNIIWLADAKHVDFKKISFALSRIESNQLACLKYAREWAKLDNLGFAIYFEELNENYWLSYDKAIECLENGVSSVNYTEMELFEEVIK